jgi:hypothetical protein
MTIIKVHGKPVEQQEKKPIELVKYINAKGELKAASGNHHFFEADVVNLHKTKEQMSHVDEYDFIEIYTGSDMTMYLGHWNDGVLPKEA